MKTFAISSLVAMLAATVLAAPAPDAGSEERSYLVGTYYFRGAANVEIPQSFVCDGQVHPTSKIPDPLLTFEKFVNPSCISGTISGLDNPVFVIC